MNQDPRTGRFTKGNSAATGDKEMRIMRSAIKEEIVKCAHSLLRPFATLEAETFDTAQPVSRYQYIINKAVASNNCKIITWVTQMAIGSPPKSELDDEYDVPLTLNPRSQLSIEDQAKLIDLSLRAREDKLQKEAALKAKFGGQVSAEIPNACTAQ